MHCGKEGLHNLDLFIKTETSLHYAPCSQTFPSLKLYKKKALKDSHAWATDSRQVLLINTIALLLSEGSFLLLHIPVSHYFSPWNEKSRAAGYGAHLSYQHSVGRSRQSCVSSSQPGLHIDEAYIEKHKRERQR